MVLYKFIVIFLVYLSLIKAEQVEVNPKPILIHHEDTIPYEDRFLSSYDVINECFQSKRIHRSTSRNVNTILFYNTTHDPLITVDEWIDRIDANNLLILSDCVKIFASENFHYRSFDKKGEIPGYRGGNNVTFLNQILPAIYPELMDQILSVASAMTDTLGWRPHPNHLGIRCIELLEYEVNGELRFHYDRESIYTLSIMISNTLDFTGGKFMIFNNNDHNDNHNSNGSNMENIVYSSPNQYGGILFDSNIGHAVTPVTSGKRIVLVLELWPFEDGLFDELRPPGELKRILPKVPTLLRVPITEPSPPKEVFSTSIDKRDLLVLCIGILLGLLLSLILVEIDNRSNRMRMKAKQTVRRNSNRTETIHENSSSITDSSHDLKEGKGIENKKKE